MLLETDVCEVITNTTATGKHSNVWSVEYGFDVSGTSHIGEVVVRVWPGEAIGNPTADTLLPATIQSPVRWVLGKDWLPFQRKTFNTPAFPGYISGHSTFSRAAAEVLTHYTGSADFPGGFHHHIILANSLQIDLGPAANVDLQWRTYYDAADQAGQSRRYGGIHVSEDDFHGREIGSTVGDSAFAMAEKYWNGSILNETIRPDVQVTGASTAVLTWQAIRGMKYKVQWTTDLITWINVTPSPVVAYDTNGTWTDTAATPAKKFYRVQRSAQ
jgi:hypothetical protein